MNKDNKILFGVILGILLLVIIVLGLNNSSEKYAEITKVISNVLESQNAEILYLDNGDCEECGFLSAQMPILITDYELGYYYIDLKDISLSKRDEALKKLGLEKFDGPQILIYKDGKLQDTLEGVNSVKTIFDFLKKNDIISKDKELVLNYLNLDGYKKLLETSGTQLLVIASAKHSYSNDAQTIFWEIAKEQNLKINYFVLSDITSDEGVEFEEALEYYKTNDMNVPDLLIIENGKVVDNLTGLATKEEYIEFLIENKIVKE